MLIKLEEHIHLQIPDGKVLYLKPLTEKDLEGKKAQWGWKKYSTPPIVDQWVTQYCKVKGITHGEFIRESILIRTKLKTLIKKIVEKRPLKTEDYNFIEQILNEPY